MNCKDKNFIKLRDKWYAKLKVEGFQDLEANSLDFEYSISSPVAMRFMTVTSEESGNTFEDRQAYYNSVQEYYSLATGFLNEHTFNSDLEKTIWYLHSEGLSYRDIAKKLTTKKFKPNKDSINQTVSNLKSLMLTGLNSGKK